MNSLINKYYKINTIPLIFLVILLPFYNNAYVTYIEMRLRFLIYLIQFIHYNHLKIVIHLVPDRCLFCFIQKFYAFDYVYIQQDKKKK